MILFVDNNYVVEDNARCNEDDVAQEDVENISRASSIVINTLPENMLSSLARVG